MTQAYRLATLTKLHDTQIPLLITAKRHGDSRGWFSETYNEEVLAQRGISCRFVQDNQSMSAHKGTIRGLHFQIPPKSQAKLVRVVRGAVLDVAVDVRAGSPTYGRYVVAELSAENGRQLFVPIGFAHGFCTLEDNTEVSYKVSKFYSPEHDAGVHWSDPRIAIPWPVEPGGAVVSDKDAKQPTLDQWKSPFSYVGMPLTQLVIEG